MTTSHLFHEISEYCVNSLHFYFASVRPRFKYHNAIFFRVYKSPDKNLTVPFNKALSEITALSNGALTTQAKMADDDDKVQSKRIFINCVDLYHGKNIAKVSTLGIINWCIS